MILHCFFRVRALHETRARCGDIGVLLNQSEKCNLPQLYVYGVMLLGESEEEMDMGVGHFEMGCHIV